MPHIVMTEGEFAGWSHWPDDTFEAEQAGPFFFRQGDEGVECAFRVAPRHLNGQGNVHGGCLMTFADFALFAIAGEALADSSGVTVSFTSEFLSGATQGALVEARGEVLRAGGSMIFVRGLVTADGTACMNFSGTIKRLRRT